MKTSSDPIASRLRTTLKGALVGALFHIFVAVKPIPAPRPRMTKFGGVFYPKNYSEFRAILQTDFARITTPLIDGPVAVAMEFVMAKAPTSKLLLPRGDLDNLEKGPMDAATDAGTIWADDTQVALLMSHKRFAEFGEAEGVHLHYGALA